MIDSIAKGAIGYGASQMLDSMGVSVMLILGIYPFSVKTASYDNFTRDIPYLWPTQQQFGGNAKPQFVGVGPIKRRLSGVIFPDYDPVVAGLYQVDLINAMASEGKPLILVTGRGLVLGYWCITSIKETQTIFHSNGKPKKIEFDLELLYFGEKDDL